jgi:dynein heavy chain, axonemal
MEWIENPKCERLIITSPAVGVLVPAHQFPAATKNKIVYFVKKGPIALTIDNIRKVVIFGNGSPNPINDLSILVDHVFYPMLSNPINRQGWPETIIKDMDFHIQELKNNIAEVSVQAI